MADSFDAFRYIGYMRSRWPWIAGSCGVAGVLALAISLTMPPQYTATALIAIEPPAGSDLRTAMTVSPIYLESLKTYEQFATSDSLFQNAMAHFGLRKVLGTGPIEGIKKRVLKVDTARNTRILEISVTMPDAGASQKLARSLAESTVEMNRSMVTESDRDLLQGMKKQEGEIHARLQQTEAAKENLFSREPVDDLQSALSQSADLRYSIQQQMQTVELELADAAERAKHASAGELAEIGKAESSARARLQEQQKQVQELDRRNAQRERELALRWAHRDHVETERQLVQDELTALQTRLGELHGDAGFRGERLRLIDPGIVPERPSSPNIPLNVLAALFLGLVLPVVYLT
ncbi:MAG TPA: Wzz/FepE/Etk N-terminal domain-containing protein, partial [Candidatus Acidoferrales bacterium]|nr:Wzz/FepE/Etk N-terminal domain-containing protein [Candidatus Acidoferrales bacterium]